MSTWWSYLLRWRTKLFASHTSRRTTRGTHFIWRIPDNASQEELLNENGRVTVEIHKWIAVYHTRAMRNEALRSFGRLWTTKPAVLREIYRQLTGDSSASTNVQ